MTIWNIIRDFFVQYIFGGIDSLGNRFNSNVIGEVSFYYDNVLDETTIDSLNVYQHYQVINLGESSEAVSIGLADWLSTTFTIITLCALCFFLFLVVRWLFRLSAGLIQGRG